MSQVIAILEDNAERVVAMRAAAEAFLPGCQIFQTDDAGTMIDWLKEHLLDVAVLSLDHDLPIGRDADGNVHDHGDGMEVANYLAQVSPLFAVIVHTSNAQASDRMVRVLHESEWPVKRVRPMDSASWVGRAWQQQLVSLKSYFEASV